MRWLLLLLMLLLPSGLAGPVAAADCGTPFYAGDWERDGAKLREFNRLQITFTCRSVPLTGGGEMTEIDYHVRAYNRCAPRDCIWGYSPARVDERGRLVANFSTFYSERVVTIEPGGIGLRVIVFTDYGDPAVEDKKEEFFLTRD